MATKKTSKFKYIIHILVLASLITSCRKKEDKPVDEAVIVPETNEIYGYFVRTLYSLGDKRGNPSFSRAGATVKAYFTNDLNWSVSRKVNSVKINSYELDYLSRSEDWFGQIGFFLKGDSLSYPQSYYALPFSVLASDSFEYPEGSAQWSVKGLNDIPDFTYIDSLGYPHVLVYIPKVTVSKSSGFTIAFNVQKDIRVRLELRDDTGSSANKYVTSLLLHPKWTNNVLGWDSVTITPSNMLNLVSGKHGASVAVVNEIMATKRISSKNFIFSIQSHWEEMINIKE